MNNIIFYIPDVDQTHGGVRQYSINLLTTIANFDQDSFHFYIYHNLKDPEVLEIIKSYKNCTLITDKDIYIPAISRRNFWRKKITLLSQFFIGKQPYRFKTIDAFDVFLKEKKIEYVHIPYQFIPKTNLSAKVICTLHDVQELHFPAFFPAKVRAYRANMYLDCVTKSHKVVVSYQHIAQDLITYFNTSPNKIQVCLLNMKDLWFNKLEQEYKNTIPSNPYKEDYLLYPANFWKHKNHQRLIEAFSIFKKQTDATTQLVLTGNNDNEEGIVVKQLVDKLGLNGDVIFAGILDEQTLYATYKNALGVVVPTLYEAGSFPLMESIIMGIPVICSNVTSLPETIGDKQFVFDPFDIEDMTSKIKQLVTDETYRHQSRLNGKKMSGRIKKTGAEEIIKYIYLNKN
ncbi:glycosyltransferase family 1 protein [uncultured Dokdonia sp.]|uniref:glycosyltransferase family 4 protein n=1 Tax=uncultured Dokdonia sp. TaxID=575653 RepID=UPI002636C3B2|nr:glycosyltransferase family 1 protein [uncultured Dokdonia sp.]